MRGVWWRLAVARRRPPPAAAAEAGEAFPPELAMGPCIEHWADPDLLAEHGPRGAWMSARRRWLDAVKVWAEAAGHPIQLMPRTRRALGTCGRRTTTGAQDEGTALTTSWGLCQPSRPALRWHGDHKFGPDLAGPEDGWGGPAF